MSKLTTAIVAIAAVLIVVSAAIILTMEKEDPNKQWDGFIEDLGTRTFDDDWIPISNLDELQAIDTTEVGKKYYLANNIDLTDHSLQDSFKIKMNVVKNDNELTVTLLISGPDGSTPMQVSEAMIFVNEQSSILIEGEAKATFWVTDSATYTISAVGKASNADPLCDSDFVLSAIGNIDELNSKDLDSKGNFVSLGTKDEPFRGTFDGNGYHLIGFRTTSMIELDFIVGSGIFACATGATIENLGLRGGSFVSISYSPTAHSFAGGFVGIGDSSMTIRNSYNTGNVTGIAPMASHIGGLMGRTYSNEMIVVENSYNEGDLTALSLSAEAAAGGLVGLASTIEINNSYNIGNAIAVALRYSDAGGLVAASSTYVSKGDAPYQTVSFITCSYNTGNIKAVSLTADADAGGLMGYVDEVIEMINSYNTGDVTVSSLKEGNVTSMGGLVGSIRSEGKKSVITNSYNVGEVQEPNKYLYSGGLVGSVYEMPTVISSYSIENNAEKLVDHEDAGTYDGLSKFGTSDEMKKASFFVNWDLDTVWTTKGDSTYPQLRTYG